MIATREELHFIINDRGYKVGVEIGVESGKYLSYLIESTQMFMYGVDCWQYIEDYNDVANISNEQHIEHMKMAFENLKQYAGRCKLLRTFSVDAAKLFEDGSLDFVYIDANHTYEGAKLDIGTWGPKVREGGMLAGHDFLDGLYLVVEELSEFGVKSAVYDYLKDKHYRLEITNELWPTWYIIKE